MALLLLIPVTAAAVALFFLLKPPPEGALDLNTAEEETSAVPMLEPENAPAMLTLHAAPSIMNRTPEK